MLSSVEARYWAYSIVLWDSVHVGTAGLAFFFVLAAWPKLLLWIQWLTSGCIADIVGLFSRWALEPGHYVYTILSKNASDVCESGVIYHNAYPFCSTIPVNEDQQLRLIQNAAMGSFVLLTVPISGLLGYLFICRTRPSENEKVE